VSFQVQWLMSVIPAIWELEIRRMEVWNQLVQKISETLSQRTSWAWWCIPCHARRIEVQGWPLAKKCKTLSEK
jgi:hypothetical protein